MKKIPLGIQTFREIIEDGHVYADKTEYIYNLIKEGKCYFLSRPRRFGKSLLLSTMAELFSGNRELFKGLWIDSSDYDFKKYPVIHISIGGIKNSTTEAFESRLIEQLEKIAARESVNIKTISPDGALSYLLESLQNRYGERVVVLIDEYEAPIIDNLLNFELAKANRQVLSTFLKVLKDDDKFIKFIFVTGVAKISHTSILSGGNNLTDISLDPNFANICGFTIDELDYLFGERFADCINYRLKNNFSDFEESEETLKGKILSWYDGYSWDGKKRVLNPFSLLNFFKVKEFQSYWFSSGTPRLLIDMIKYKPFIYNPTTPVNLSKDDFDSVDFDQLDFEPLMFQSGYLTVDRIERSDDKSTYQLKTPNFEVGNAFNKHILTALTKSSQNNIDTYLQVIEKAMISMDPLKLQEAFIGFWASIPYEVHNRLNEAYYQSLVYSIMINIASFQTTMEGAVGNGIFDMAVVIPGKTVYVLEFKYQDIALDAPLEERTKRLESMAQMALEQIENKGYALKYLPIYDRVIKVALCVVGRTDTLIKFA